MRLNYCDDEDFPGQFMLWQANCHRSVNGKKGQAFLRRVEAALLAMPEKRLIREAIVEADGDVCALGSVAVHEGKEVSPELDYDPEDFGMKLGAPRLVAWRLVEINDIQCDYDYLTAQGPLPINRGGFSGAGYSVRVNVTPEERYERVLAWVRSQLHVVASERETT